MTPIEERFEELMMKIRERVDITLYDELHDAVTALIKETDTEDHDTGYNEGYDEGYYDY